MGDVEQSQAISRAGGPAASTDCRFCGGSRLRTFVDLGMSPLCESFLTAVQLNHMEPFYPLHVLVCEECLLVQLGEYVSPAEIFSEYLNSSSVEPLFLLGDSLALLRQLPDQSVDFSMTSPPAIRTS